MHSIRRILEVKDGARGIRQSDAVFIHLKTLPILYGQLSEKADLKKVKAVGVSTRPRNVQGSYMPVFVAGESFASVIADTLKVPCCKFSHQDGHIMAGIYSCGEKSLINDKFLSVHLSGGTTEILKCEYNGCTFSQEIAGASSDISAGQFIDRAGVGMGIKFPCGAELEKLAAKTDRAVPLPVSVKDTYMSFSGVETKVGSMIGSADTSELARGVLMCVAKSLTKAVNNAAENTGVGKVLFVGGVASDVIICEYLKKHLNVDVYFASRELSSDNAVGIGLLAQRYNLK